MRYELIQILDNILGPHQRHANDEYYWSCPFCHHHNPKLAINLNKNAWHCWVCEQSGKKIISLLKRLNASSEDIVKVSKLLNEYIPTNIVKKDDTILSLPTEYHPLYKPIRSYEYLSAINYLRNRNINTYDILRYELGFCTQGSYANRIIVPSYDANNKLNYFVGRTFYDGGMKYKNPTISKDVVVFENQINWSYPIVLCEGVFDAIAIKRNAVPLLGKIILPNLMMKILERGVKDVYIALDTDAIKNTVKSIDKLMAQNINVYHVELSGKDPSEIGFEKMQNLIKSANRVTFGDLVKLKVSF